MISAHRFPALRAKLVGKAPLCPWLSIVFLFDPATRRAFPPPAEIEILDSSPTRHLLRFGHKHSFWFPDSVLPGPELWHEYLAVCWSHAANFHYYLRHIAALSDDDVVLDCGACEGFFTRLALEFGVRKVICVEPSPAMVGCLHDTFAEEVASGRVSILPVGLSSVNAEACFSTSDGDPFGGHVARSGASRITLSTIDDIVDPKDPPTFLKMDLEGAEYEALRGATEFLSAVHPRIAVTTYHYRWDYAVVSAYLRAIGYRHVIPSGATLRAEITPRPVMAHAW